jgi:hypothetical protein
MEANVFDSYQHFSRLIKVLLYTHNLIRLRWVLIPCNRLVKRWEWQAFVTHLMAPVPGLHHQTMRRGLLDVLRKGTLEII